MDNLKSNNEFYERINYLKRTIKSPKRIKLKIFFITIKTLTFDYHDISKLLFIISCILNFKNVSQKASIN
jgi:hypothetical protein